MSLDAILRAISASGEDQVRQIEARASAQVDDILSNARREASQLRKQAFNEAVAPAAKERSRIIHRARLEALQITGNLRDTLVDTALKQVVERLACLRAESAYADVFRRLVQETLAELGISSGEGGSACLEVDPRDRALLESILAEMKLHLPVQYNLDCWGGILARSEDGRVEVINILEARLERATPYLRRYLAALFEAKECQISTTVTPAYVP